MAHHQVRRAWGCEKPIEIEREMAPRIERAESGEAAICRKACPTRLRSESET
jgi:hypothetical protein